MARELEIKDVIGIVKKYAYYIEDSEDIIEILKTTTHSKNITRRLHIILNQESVFIYNKHYDEYAFLTTTPIINYNRKPLNSKYFLYLFYENKDNMKVFKEIIMNKDFDEMQVKFFDNLSSGYIKYKGVIKHKIIKSHTGDYMLYLDNSRLIKDIEKKKITHMTLEQLDKYMYIDKDTWVQYSVLSNGILNVSNMGIKVKIDEYGSLSNVLLKKEEVMQCLQTLKGFIV